MSNPSTLTYSDQHAFPSILELENAAPEPIYCRSLEVVRFDGIQFVRAIGDNGQIGIATCNARAHLFVPILKHLVFPVFTGQDIRNLETLINLVYVYQNNYKCAGIPFWSCVAYVEAALFDLLGKSTGHSVAELIGKPIRREISVYLSYMGRDTSPEEELEYIGGRLEATGARAAKFKIGGRMRNNEDSIPNRTETLIRKAPDILKQAEKLYVDANGSYDHHRAIEIGKLLEEHGFDWFEEPCPFEQYSSTKAVADALSISVAGGEQDCNMATFRMMTEQCFVDIIQPDMTYNGGIIRALRVAKLAREQNMLIVPHSPKHNSELAPLLQFAAVVDNLNPFIEYPGWEVEPPSWYGTVFALQPGGILKIPSCPGLGIAYDESIWGQAELL